MYARRVGGQREGNLGMEVGVMGRQFDELSKDLARGVSRRRALRRFGASVLGVVAARVVPGPLLGAATDEVAMAAPLFGRNSFCTVNSTMINGRFLDFSTATSGQQVVGTDHDDIIIGSRFGDQIDARGGDDCVLGGDGNDQIVGGPGNDELFGEDGDDQLVGRAGRDLMDGGDGTDACAGGPGGDFAVDCEQTQDVP